MGEITNKFDKNLIDGLKNLDPSVIATLYKDYLPRISSSLMKINLSEDESKDIFQNALLMFYQKLKDENFILNSSVYTFLLSVSKNMALKEIRKRNPIYNYSNEISDSALKFDEQEIQIMRTALLWKWINKLDDQSKKIIELNFQDMPAKDIADELNLSLNSYRVKKSRSIKKLKGLIESDPMYHELNID